MVEKENQHKEKLKDYGIIYISGEIDNSKSEEVCKEIIELNIKKNVEHIQIIINSAGGITTAGFAIVDIIEWSKIPVYTTGIGIIASMGLIIFMTGEKGRRVITPRTSILSHKFSWSRSGNYSELLAIRKAEDMEYKKIVEHYLKYTNIKSQDELEKTLLKDTDTWLTPEEAVKYGIADFIEPLKIK